MAEDHKEKPPGDEEEEEEEIDETVSLMFDHEFTIVDLDSGLQVSKRCCLICH